MVAAERNDVLRRVGGWMGSQFRAGGIDVLQASR